MDISNIQNLLKNNEIKWSVHCLERMQERNISILDVHSCITTGEIIEDYPDDYPYPSCLVFGYAVSQKILHVVVGSDGHMLYIILVGKGLWMI